MRVLIFVGALCLVLLTLWETFETVVLPRRIERRFRMTRLYYLASWRVFCLLFEGVRHPKRRASFMSIFGPLSLLGLFVLWGLSLVFAFALLNWSMQSSFKMPDGDVPGFLLDLYVSGTTFSTLGLGDVTPLSAAARVTTVVEGSMGLGIVALVIGYLPALYQAFSRRETEISLLDARAGSPPSATELLLRSVCHGRPEGFEKFLADWERWCSEIMESHISYPVLCFFRSQHTNQSWLTAINAVLDSCALCLACLEHESKYQAHLTFAMGRHAVVDIAQVFHKKPLEGMAERLTREEFRTICVDLRQNGLKVCPEEESWDRIKELRLLYEPYVFTLSRQLRMELAPWVHPAGVKDNWAATKWRGQFASSSQKSRLADGLDGVIRSEEFVRDRVAKGEEPE